MTWRACVEIDRDEVRRNDLAASWRYPADDEDPEYRGRTPAELFPHRFIFVPWPVMALHDLALAAARAATWLARWSGRGGAR